MTTLFEDYLKSLCTESLQKLLNQQIEVKISL